MQSPTWAEYLAEATEQLEKLRSATQSGNPPPPALSFPPGSVPDDLLEEALRLAAQYDELADEVRTRMSEIADRFVQSKKSPHSEQQTPTFIEVSA